jgi:hypothetical protein
MFQRTDHIAAEDIEDRFPLHVVDFHWDDFTPHMECFDLRSRQVSEFDLDDVRFSASKRKVCVGSWDDDVYKPCPNQTPVDRFDQCAQCAKESFIPKQECIFEPECDGEKCDIEFCKREHVLYIAFYDTRMKIGMSSTRRVEKRLVEQGADAFSIIGKFGSRKKAREAEKDISSRLKIPQSHRQQVLLDNFARSVDSAGIQGRHEALVITLGEAYHLTPEPLKWLLGYPIDLPLREPPKLLRSWGKHAGELVGMKGKWLVFEAAGLKAITLPDLPARFLSRDAL